MSHKLLAITRRQFLETASLTVPWALFHGHANLAHAQPAVGEADSAIGTCAGSFIVVKKDRLWFPERKSPAIVCPTVATIRAPSRRPRP
jgi:hypothetical protein